MTAPWPSSTSREHKRWDKTAGRFVFVENGSAHLPCCFSWTAPFKHPLDIYNSERRHQHKADRCPPMRNPLRQPSYVA